MGISRRDWRRGGGGKEWCGAFAGKLAIIRKIVISDKEDEGAYTHIMEMWEDKFRYIIYDHALNDAHDVARRSLKRQKFPILKWKLI